MVDMTLAIKKSKDKKGLILCRQKDKAIVKYSVMKENKQIFASKYMLYLPSEQELAHEIEKDTERK